MPSNKFTCVDCGGPVTSQQAPAKAAAMRCHPCRRLKRVKPCAYCGNTFVWPDSHPRKYCSKQCLSQSMQIRPPDDIRVRRIHREQAAPGLNPGQRYKLRDKRIAQGHKCAYCQAQADTIDHVVPLVRGGTNYEGNLVVCCRSCNSSKSGSTIMEWRTGRRLPRMTTAVVWPARPVRQPKAKPPKIEHNCPICGTPTTRTKYCTTDCADEALARYIRDRYRTKAGLPPQPRKPTNTERSQRIQQREHLLG